MESPSKHTQDYLWGCSQRDLTTEERLTLDEGGIILSVVVWDRIE